MGMFDPELPFKIGPMNGREARESGLRLGNDWSLTSLKEKLIKIGAKVVSHNRYVAFQMVEVAVPTNVFADILRITAELQSKSKPAPT